MDNTTQAGLTLEGNPLSTTIVYTLFGIFGIAGNGLVLLVIALVDDLHGVTNLFIANQSLIDLMSSVVLIANFVVPLPPLPAGRPALALFLCRFWHTRYPFWSLIVASSLNLTLMTLERYYAIFYPIRFRSQTNSKCLKLIATLPWVIGFLFQVISTFFAHVENDTCIMFSSDTIFNIVAFGSVIVLLEFVLPLFVMIFVYTSIVIKLRKDAMRRFDSRRRRETSVDKPEVDGTTDYRSRARRNTIKTMLTVSIFFILCWSLNQTLVAVGIFGGGIDFNSLLYQISVFMGFGNMWINPFIYSFQYRRFQKGLKKIFCMKGRNLPSQEVETISKGPKSLD